MMKKVFVTVIAILCIMLVGCSVNDNPPPNTSEYEIMISDVIQVYVWKDNQIVPQLVNDKGEVIDARYDYVSSSDDITISYDGHITINSIPEDDVTVTITERNTGLQKSITLHFIADIQKVNAVSKETGEVATELNGLSYNSKTTLNVITDQTDVDISSFCDITCTDENGNEVSAFEIEYDKNHILLTATGLGEGTLNIQINNSKGESLYQTSIPFSINWDEIALQNCVLNSVEKTLLSKEDITSIKSITIDEQVKLLLEVEHLSSLETIVIDSSEVQEFIYDSVIYNYRIKEHLYDDYYNHEFWANKQGNLIPYKNSTSENYIVYHSDRSTTMSVALITNTLAFPVLEFDGYTNIGWKNSSDKTVEASELLSFDRGVIHLYAIWEANGNRVVFNGNGATSGNMEDQVIATDYSANLTQNTYIRTGYTFIGWATTPTGAVTYSDCASFAMDKTSVTNLYAVWTPNENGINFHANGGTGTMSVQSASTGETKTLSQNQFTRSGYTFAGWSTTPTGAIEYTDQAQYTMGTDSSYTLYAVWTPIQYSISYNLGGGTDMGNQEQYNIESDQITLIAPTRSGYVFAGWTGEGITKPTKDVSIPTGNIGNKTYTAVWAATIYFHSNGGQGTIESAVVINNTSNFVLPKHTYTKDGYLFDGWATTANGAIAYEKEAFFNCGANGEYHLYAVWNEGTEGLLFEENDTGYSVVGYSGDIAQVNIPRQYRGKSVTYIVSGAFRDNKTITSMVIPSSVSDVADDILEGCNNLTSLTLPHISDYSLGSIFGGYYSSDSSTVVPATLRTLVISGGDTIASNAFAYCANIQTISIPYTITRIGTNSFYGCTSLSNIILPVTITDIGDGAFGWCGGLTNVYYGGNIAAWCQINFSNYSSNPMSCANSLFVTNTNEEYERVTELVIPDEITEVKAYAFYGCNEISSIIVPNQVISIGKAAFGYCDSLYSLTIPFIGNNAQATNSYFGFIFGANEYQDNNEFVPKSLRVVNITSATELGAYSFYACRGLTRIELPNTLKTIGDGAFMDCTAISSITIPESVETIKSTAFLRCYKLIEVYNLSEHIVVSTNSTTDGDIGRYAKDVYTNINETSKIITQDDFMFYWDEDNSKYYLLGYIGVDTDVQLPNDIDGKNYEIYQYAFYYSSITKINIPITVEAIQFDAFTGCTELITIENGVSYVDKWVIQCSTTRTNAELRQDTVGIANSAFWNCTKLKSINLSECNQLRYIGQYAFVLCSGLTNIELPNGVDTIGIGAFKGCSSLTSISLTALQNQLSYYFETVPASLKTVCILGGESIPNNAFANCTNITTIVLPEGLKTIGDRAFYRSGITKIDIPSSVNRIGQYAFSNCSSLDGVYITDISKWMAIDYDSGFGYYNYGNPLEYAENLYLNGTLITELVVPEGIIGIAMGAFANCKSIEKIVIPESVGYIGDYAFYSCNNVSVVTFATNSSLRSIGAYAFSGCNITRITIPKNVTRIGSNAFEGCNQLKEATFKGNMLWFCTTPRGSTNISWSSSTIAATHLTTTFCQYEWRGQ